MHEEWNKALPMILEKVLPPPKLTNILFDSWKYMENSRENWSIFPLINHEIRTHNYLWKSMSSNRHELHCYVLKLDQNYSKKLLSIFWENISSDWVVFSNIVLKWAQNMQNRYTTEIFLFN